MGGRGSDRAGLVTTARRVIIECGVGHLDLWSRFSRGDTADRYRQGVHETVEGAVIGPVQLRGTHVDIIMVECLDVEPVCGRTLQPKPITRRPQVLVRINLALDRVRASTHELEGSSLLIHREVIHDIDLTRWACKSLRR